MMPRVVELEQGSPAWKDWRNAGIGASDLPVIMGVSPYSKPAALWEVKRNGIDTFQGNWATERGQRLEPEARRLAEESLRAGGIDVHLEPVCFESAHNEWQRASLDGFGVVVDIFGLDTRIGVELKCLGEKAHMEAVTSGKIPPHYIPQLAWQEHVAILDHVFIGFYNPDIADESSRFVLLEWECPAGYMCGILEAADEFHDSLKKSVNPYETKVSAPDSWQRAAQEYIELKAAADEASARADEAKKRLLEIAGDREIEDAGVRVQRITTKGSVDWAKFQKAHGELSEEIEAYRKPESVSVRVSIVKE